MIVVIWLILFGLSFLLYTDQFCYYELKYKAEQTQCSKVEK